jgi:hypothetical protein
VVVVEPQQQLFPDLHMSCTCRRRSLVRCSLAGVWFVIVPIL